MIGHESITIRSRNRLQQCCLTLALLTGMAGCSRPDSPAAVSSGVLRIGFGLTTGQNSSTGIQQAIRNIASEGLLAFSRNGRPQPWLAQSWSSSDDGRTLTIQLRPNVEFHNGRPVDAQTVVEILSRRLRSNVGPAYSDVERITAKGSNEIEIKLKRRSNFIIEGLDVLIEAPGEIPSGTGAFIPVADGSQLTMVANENYYGGRPIIDRIVFQPYNSVRAAWADLLRNDVDMLYDVGIDAVDSLAQSSQTKVVSNERPYTYMVLLNVSNPRLRDARVRRQLNLAINRNLLISEVLKGHGKPANSPVSPHHWAFTGDLPTLSYAPSLIADDKTPLQFTCIFADASLERLGLGVQSQLSAVGVDMRLELLSIDAWFDRVNSGQFDAILADVTNGPTMVRPYLFWKTGAPNNWGHYSNPKVDAAFDAMRYAPDDAAYKAGLADYERAIVEDPPAIFLAWSERARAVSTRFDVPVEPGRDILSTLRLWRPLAPPRTPSPN